MKFCPECGAAVSGGKFCSECGHRLQDNVVPNVSAATPPPVGIGFDLPNLGGFDALGTMANNCVAQDQAQQEAEALAPFVVEKHQNGKYAILELKDKSEMDIVVPNGVEAIGDGAFEGSDVMSVTLPEGLLKIGSRAFANCIDLDRINFPQSLRVISDEAFAGCENLDVEPPEGVRIGENAFLGTGWDKRCQEQEQDPEYSYKKGENFFFGKGGVKENVVEALKWYRKAAELGHAGAQWQIWDYYERGGYEDNKIEETEALKWLHEAGRQGHVDAQYKLGHNYFRGSFVRSNMYEAKRWFRLAEAQGSEKAKEYLEYLRREGLIK